MPDWLKSNIKVVGKRLSRDTGVKKIHAAGIKGGSRMIDKTPTDNAVQMKYLNVYRQRMLSGR